MKPLFVLALACALIVVAAPVTSAEGNCNLSEGCIAPSSVVPWCVVVDPYGFPPAYVTTDCGN